MDKLLWREDLATGFADIDGDHKELFGYLNVLENSIKDKKGHEMSRGILGGLFDYARYHFAREEEIFTKHKEYTLCSFHLEEHRYFVAELEKFTEFLSSGTDRSGEIAAFLSKWLVRHIMTVDKTFFQSHAK